MPNTVLVHSGLAGTAPAEVSYQGDGTTAELDLALNFRKILTQFKTTIGVDYVRSRVLPEMSTTREIMIEVVGGDQNPDKVQGSVTIHFHILKLRAAEDPENGPAAESAIYSVNRLLNLLLANGHFNNMNGIGAIANYNFIAGQPYSPPVNIAQDHQDQFDGALVQITYNYQSPSQTSF